MENEDELRKEIAEEVFHGVSYPMLDNKGEKEVRRALAKGEYGGPGEKKGHDLVLSWLATKDTERAEESLSISRKALRNSERATRIAIIAIILSIIMAILKLIEHYSK